MHPVVPLDQLVLVAMHLGNLVDRWVKHPVDRLDLVDPLGPLEMNP
jgi:hypothetical protein